MVESAEAADTVAERANYVAIRLDPGLLSAHFKANSPVEPLETIARRVAKSVVADAKKARAKAIFVIAYSPVFGPYYLTEYDLAKPEQNYGKTDFVKKLTEEAHLEGIEVVASFHLNNYHDVAEAHKDWREKTRDTPQRSYVYPPEGAPTAKPLSPHHPKYREWFEGLINDFLARNPEIDGLEGFEGYVDWRGYAEADFNLEAKKDFQKQHPDKPFEVSPEWRRHRAKGMTELHKTLFEAAKREGKKALFVQTWTAHDDGELWSIEQIRDAFGFDLRELVKLKPSGVVCQFIWQQWAAKSSATPGVFNPDWTQKMAKVARGNLELPEGVKFFVHIELTKFPEGKGTISLDRFLETLKKALTVSGNVTIYDYRFLKDKDLNGEEAFAKVGAVVADGTD